MSRADAHVVVIGAGMGGLAAALDLAASGRRVTLIERHDAPGGKIRQVEVNGRHIDCGPTVFTMRGVFDDLFADSNLALDDFVTLSRAQVLARHSWPDRSHLDLFVDVDASAAAIEAFSDQGNADAYRRFAAASARIFETLDRSFMRCARPTPVALSLSLGLRGIPRLLAARPFVSLWQELGRYFTDPRLRQLFGRYATYCGSSPFDAPATLMLIAHAERTGVWLVEGGMRRLSDAVAAAAAERGAELRFGTGVAAIRTGDGSGFDVELDNDDRLVADAVIYNGDVAALEQGLLGDGPRDALRSRRAEPRSLSAITWSLTASTDFPLAHHTVFFGSDYASEFASIFEHRGITHEPTVYVCAQERGNDLSGSRRAAEPLFLLINAPAAEISHSEIERAEANAFALLERQGLRLSRQSPNMIRQTPATFGRLFPGSDGAIYGWPTHGWFGSFRRSGAATAVPGLFCAGGTVHPGPGVPMTALSGRIAAAAVRDYLG